ncbi:MAG TPA: methyltransferase [Streptosporangiaceae bacterium]
MSKAALAGKPGAQPYELFEHGIGGVAGNPLVLVIILFAVLCVGLLIWGLGSGRSVDLGSVEFGPLKFGPVRLRRAPAQGQAGDLEAAGRHRDPMSVERDPAGTRIYHPDQAARFYDEIAVNYDQRNSPNLLATHMEVISQVDQARQAKPDLNVLDLGGGTGQNVATHFFNDTKIRWTYVDFSHAMVDQLQQHLAGRPLYERLRVHVGDIDSVHRQLKSGSYDVVLLNLVLSSMPRLPDFNPIARLLAPGGLLVVSDINPLYTRAHPYYRATAADGTPVALRTRPVEPLDVVTRANDAGLGLRAMRKIGSAAISYSFIAVFAAAVLPHGHQGRPGAEALPR